MNIRELMKFLEDDISYPIDQASVIGQIGGIEIEAPDRNETETVSSIISSVGEETYGSPDELFETIIGNVSDEYIGRKFYDDRGGNPPETASGPTDEVNVSF